MDKINVYITDWYEISYGTRSFVVNSVMSVLDKHIPHRIIIQGMLVLKALIL